MSQAVIFDMTFTLFHTVSLLSVFRYWEKKKHIHLYIFFAASAIACLTKGLIGIVFPLIIGSTFFLIRKGYDFSYKPFFKGLFLFFIIFFALAHLDIDQ
jgi:4-amino-4-deoxy-L-arabinose transferase-like glycosyltransferase